MSGWEKVLAATVLAMIGLIGMNLAIWRRLKFARVMANDRAELRVGAIDDADRRA